MHTCIVLLPMIYYQHIIQVLPKLFAESLISLFIFIYTNHLRTRPNPLNVKGYRSLQQQEHVNPPFEFCEIVIWWKAFISEGDPKAFCVRKKA